MTLTAKMTQMNSDDERDNHKSGSNSLKSECGVWTVKSFRYSI